MFLEEHYLRLNIPEYVICLSLFRYHSRNSIRIDSIVIRQLRNLWIALEAKVEMVEVRRSGRKRSAPNKFATYVAAPESDSEHSEKRQKVDSDAYIKKSASQPSTKTLEHEPVSTASKERPRKSRTIAKPKLPPSSTSKPSKESQTISKHGKPIDTIFSSTKSGEVEVGSSDDATMQLPSPSSDKEASAKSVPGEITAPVPGEITEPVQGEITKPVSGEITMPTPSEIVKTVKTVEIAQRPRPSGFPPVWSNVSNELLFSLMTIAHNTTSLANICATLCPFIELTSKAHIPRMDYATGSWLTVMEERVPIWTQRSSSLERMSYSISCSMTPSLNLSAAEDARQRTE